MGLIKAAMGAIGGTLADQWKEYFYCDSMSADVLAAKGQKRTGSRSSNTKGEDNIITSGSVIAVNEGQCMMIVEDGKVAELCAEPGEFIYDSSASPSVFSGKLLDGLKGAAKDAWERFKFGGIPGRDQRIYYFNIKEIPGNKYGTPSPVPFRVVDRNIGLDVDISIRCNGEYSYRIVNPMVFYANVCANVRTVFTRSEIDSMLKTEILTALGPALARISAMGIRYSELPAHNYELTEALNEVLSEKWGALRGLQVYSFGINSANASKEDEDMIKELQKNAAFRDPTLAAANLVGAQAAAMQSAAKNEGGAAMAFMGMNMAQQSGGFNAQSLYQMGAQQQAAQPQQPAQPSLPAGGWTCPSCGTQGIQGKFCPECGGKKPEPAAANGWTCPSCGTVNKGKFCAECGTKKPAGVPKYRCDKCGWEPADPTKPPKFCPECGDPFNDGDIV